MKNKTCLNCQWCYNTGCGRCYCHRFPPTICADVTDGGHYPKVDIYTAVCGEYKAVEKKKPTNGDKIRQMSNKELVQVLYRPNYPPNCDATPKEQCKSCRQCWLAWLNAPAESEGEDK